jgi:branched-chain amino acid transport system ATP-binding protein
MASSELDQNVLNSMKEKLLIVRNLRKNFGGLAAINDLDTSVEEGEIRGLIGPNGSGKTTFFNVITGYYKPTTGIVRFAGKSLQNMKPNEVARLGMVRTFQMTTLFHEMTVLQNVYLGYHLQIQSRFFSTLLRTSGNRNEEKEIFGNAHKLLDFLGIEARENELAKNLPHGHQRRLGIAIALATKPRLLLLDEPLTGMNPTEARNMVDQIRKIRDEMGISVIIVEHNIRAILGLCDRVTVLNYGQKIFEGSAKEVAKDKTVVEAYLGVDEVSRYVL